MSAFFDAIVMGGGPSGSAAAILLAQAGWSVAVVEKSTFPRRKVCGEFLSATNIPLLEILGISAEFAHRAGPQVRQVAIYAGRDAVIAGIPPVSRDGMRWGRALVRDELDALLLKRAGSLGAQIFQPCSIKQLRRDEDGAYTCELKAGENLQSIRGRVIIAANGSWEPGPVHKQKAPIHKSDLFAFKAHLSRARLSSGLMPLLAFPGGYGGMVHVDADRISLSFCIRRDRLEELRARQQGSSAGDVVLGHIAQTCRAAGEVLKDAKVEGAWLAAGPIRPGIRLKTPENVFPVGNAAGEAHPVIAEGISMAMQSSLLLTRELTQSPLNLVGKRYGSSWYRAFAPRLYAASVVAHCAMNPTTAFAAAKLAQIVPQVLTLGAQLSGKSSLRAVYAGT